MMVLSTGPRGIEFFDEWMLTYASDEGMSESDAEMLLILHWLQFAEGVGLSPGHVKAPQALFRVAKE